MKLARATALLVGVSLVGPASAQPADPGEPVAEVDGEPAPADEYATTVVGTRSRGAIVRDSRAVSVVDRRTLDETAPESASEALHLAPGVSVQKTNHAGGSPYIRGRTGQETVLMVDGFRIGTSIMRAGPNQYFNTVDPAGLERIEVLRGAGSVLYGSDAIGGVISATTRSPSRRGTSGLVAARAASADRSTGGRAQLDTTIDDVGILVGFSGAAIGDLRGGGPLPLASEPIYEDSVQSFTSYDQLGGDAKATMRAGAGELTLAATTFRLYDAARTDKCGPDDCRYFDDQYLDLVYARWASGRVGSLRDVEAGVAISRTLENRSRVRALRPTSFERDRVLTLQYFARATPLWRSFGDGAAFQLTTGSDGFVDRVSSSAEVGEGVGAVPDLRGKYLDGSDYTTAAAYGFGELVVSPALAFTLGARAAYTRAFVAADPESGTPAFSDAHLVPVVGGGVRVGLTSWLAVVGNLDQGYRAPNLDDLTARSSEGPGYQLPNAALEPERSVSLEAGVVARHERVGGSLFAYQTYIDQFITRIPAMCPVALQARCAGSENVFQVTNTASASIHGFEFDARVQLPAGVSVSGVVTYTHADTIDADEVRSPDSKIPPLSGRLGVRFDVLDGRYFVESISDFGFSQTRLSVADQADARIPEGGTPGYGAVHLRGGLRLGDDLVATVTLQNLTNTGYRIHGSGVDAPGFGGLLSISASAGLP